MNELSQIQRLLRILQILSSGRKVTTTELQHRFNGAVSLRTLQRDLLALSEAGIPLISEKTAANENIWSLMSRFRSFIPLPLETNEYLAAHILKANLKVFQKTPFGDEIKSLIKKIDQIVPEDVFLETDDGKADKLFENYSAGNFDYSPHGETINKLISAILHGNICEVTYQNPYASEEKTYPIEPVRLVYYSGGLYVIVYFRKYEKFRLLAIQRIKKLIITDENYPQDHLFDPDLFWKNKFGLFSADQVEVTLQFSKEIRHHIEGRTWHHSQEMKVKKDGTLVLSMKVGLSPELVSWIMGWHEYVTVKSPDELIDTIKSAHYKSLEKYK
jgi:predicted DNA-binding transcriptional regulator YafY